MKKKLIVLGLSLVGVLMTYISLNARDFGLCPGRCSPVIDKYQEIFVFFPLLLFFSLVTLNLKDAIFENWLRYSYVVVPVVFLVSYVISLELHHNPGGFFNTDVFADVLYYSLLYGAYIIGSLVAIYRSYSKSKKVFVRYKCRFIDMKKKLAMLLVSFVGSYVALGIFYTQHLKVCDFYCGKNLGEYQNIFLFFPFVLFFSVVSFLLPEKVFANWWNFSKIAVPCILLLSLVVNLGLHNTHGGYMNTSDMFDVPFLVTLYAGYTLGSLIAIYRGYRQSKLGGAEMAAGKRVGDGGRVI